MKKYIIFILSIIMFVFVGCTNQAQKTPPKADIDSLVAINLEKIDKNYSNETLKALSVILRTNLTINNEEIKDLVPNNKYLEIVKLTKNEMLKNDKNNLIETSLIEKEEYHWQKTIKKTKILEFALKNKINLTNISQIEPVFENEKIKGINIGGKFFDYQLLISEFGLESNNIESIETTKTEVIIKGKNQGFFDKFNIDKAEQLSNDNHNYKDILKIFFNDLKIN